MSFKDISSAVGCDDFDVLQIKGKWNFTAIAVHHYPTYSYEVWVSIMYSVECKNSMLNPFFFQELTLKIGKKENENPRTA